MKINTNLAVSDSGFIFNPGTGDSFSVNTIGLEILNGLRKEDTIEQIIEKLSEKYEVEKAVLRKDVDDFITLLRDQKMLQ